jgi:anaerobic ribonucleoside-triphosphate reductase activating protein
MKFVNYSVVFQEIPDEVTLAINLSNCPNRCNGCHSPYLREDIGRILNEQTLSDLLNKYHNAITCVCFMGGDASPKEIEQLAGFLREKNGTLKTGWYSGKDKFPDDCSLQNFNYIKLGQYRENLGGLNSQTTNQRFYRIENNTMIDMTYLFQRC